MKTGFSPLVGRAEFFKHQEISPSEKKAELNADIQSESPSAPLTSIQLTRLQTQDLGNASLKKGIFKGTPFTPALTGRRFTTWIEVKSGKLFAASRKAAQAELNAIQKAIDAEIIQDYIEKCMINLKDNLKKLLLQKESARKQAVKQI